MLEIHFDELETLPDRELPPSDWFEIDQARVNQFADATLDHQWIHLDVDRAKDALGGTIAHGFLVISLLPMLSKQVMQVNGMASALNYGSDRVRFTGMTHVGSRVRLVQSCMSVTPKSGGKLIKMSSTIEIEGKDKPAMMAEMLSLYFGA